MDLGDENLLNVLRLYRQAVIEENPNMSPAEREHKFQARWDRISTQLNGRPTGAAMIESLVPQKRPASCNTHFGLEPSSKRAAAASSNTSAPPLERHISAPTGYSNRRTSNGPVDAERTTKSTPINIPQPPDRFGRRSSTSNASYNDRPANFQRHDIAPRIRDMAPAEYLARLPDGATHLAPTFAFTVPESGHGEWNVSNVALFTNPSSFEDTHSLATATSDSGLTMASTALSEPITRCNTCNTSDQICESLGMFNMDPSLVSFPDGSMRGMTGTTYPSLSVHSRVDSSHLSFSGSVPEYQAISYSSSMMKPSLSQESVSSSSTDSFSYQFPLSMSVGQSVQAKHQPRSIAPKKQDDASSQPPMPKLVAIKGEDGTIKHKAEISRAARQPQQRKTQFCDFCNDQPQGFHGEHELRRHMDRQHTQYRKVWICRDISEDGTFLRNCKACRNNKTYGANYNAAAHLRRTHFNPCKNKRGGRGKKSEGRGGMGGGNSPSMEELKKWMFETYEMNLNGRAIVQHMPADTSVPHVPMDELVEFDPSIQTGQVYSPVRFPDADEYDFQSY